MTIKEKDLYSAIETTGPFADEIFFYEVPIGPPAGGMSHADMVILKNKKSIAIEVKISNWKKVFKQAHINTYYYDYSYVALWHKAIPNINMNFFKKWGIGILKVDEFCEEILKAKRSKSVISKYGDYAKNYCESRTEIIDTDYTAKL